MDEPARNSNDTVGSRRRYLRGIVSVATPLLAGCGGSNGSSTSRRRTTDEEPEARSRLVSDIESVYERLDDLRVVEGDRVVLTPQAAEERVDVESLLKDARDVRDRVGDLDEERRTAALAVGAGLATQLSYLRVNLLDVMIGSDLYGRQMDGGEYEAAVETADRSREALEDLGENVEFLSDALGDAHRADGLDLHYPFGREERAVDTLAGVLEWCDPALSGLAHTARAQALIFDAMEDGEYADAKAAFEEGDDHLARAEADFDDAHDSGQPLEYVRGLVEDYRCAVGPLRNGFGNFDDALDELERGNERAGRELAREPYRDMLLGLEQCMERNR